MDTRFDIRSYQLQGQAGRLDRVLTELAEGLSRSQIQSLIKQGLVTVNGQTEKANHQLTGSEVIQIRVPLVEEVHIEAQAMSLEILYEDDFLLVVNKPAGLVVHPAKGHPDGTLVNGLVYYLRDQISKGDSIRPGIVHRLDKDTSGLIMVAKNNQVHQALSDLIQARELDRYYLALVHGHLSVDQGSIELPLARQAHNRLRYQVDPQGKYALTHYQVMEEYDEMSLVRLQLITGRTHQIRVHMEYIGHPVVGDPIYRQGLAQLKSPLAELQEGQYLHAYRLIFEHPVTKQGLEIESDQPQRFKDLIQRCRA